MNNGHRCDPEEHRRTCIKCGGDGVRHMIATGYHPCDCEDALTRDEIRTKLVELRQLEKA
jgi:hypothetical protein